MNTTKKGAMLEIYVKQLFKDLCKLKVRRNVQYRCKGVLTNKNKRAQIDVEFWDLKGKTIVECKYYGSSKVSVTDVDEFYQRSKLVRHTRKIMVTNTCYTQGAVNTAKEHGIRLIDADQLKKMDYERLSLVGMIKDRLGKRKSLDEQIKDADLRNYGEYYSAKQYLV
ncbi:MAG: hypothetical protein MAG795_00696 [Candidatus Woesearchaeota archaeon]|nr:hypothetical protein [Candidatus Woesearchaeota archaeon]